MVSTEQTDGNSVGLVEQKSHFKLNTYQMLQLCVLLCSECNIDSLLGKYGLCLELD